MKLLELMQYAPREVYLRWAQNLIKFTAPALAIFFAQLSLGVDWRTAGMLAVFALYGALADLFKKVNEWGRE